MGCEGGLCDSVSQEDARTNGKVDVLYEVTESRLFQVLLCVH